MDYCVSNIPLKNKCPLRLTYKADRSFPGGKGNLFFAFPHLTFALYHSPITNSQSPFRPNS